jgi:hypothetical protein
MPYRFLSRAAIIAVLSVGLIAPADAESIDTAGKQITAGIAAASVAVRGTGSVSDRSLPAQKELRYGLRCVSRERGESHG